MTLPEPALRALRTEPVMIVNLAAIRRNFRKLSKLSGQGCAAVVKGDGYGHGMHESARALAQAQADLFFVARFEDAMQLRVTLGEGPHIAVLDGIPNPLLREALRNDIWPVVNTPAQLQALHSLAVQVSQRLPAFVHIDTAMNRLGLSPAEAGEAASLLEGLDVKAYMTHFAAADDVDLDLCRSQVSRLRSACKVLPPAPLSIANSCGVFLGKAFHGAITRPGKSTFGINPLPEGANPMEEPAQVHAAVVQIRHLNRGDPVGYSSTWRAPDARRIALLAIGYSNGYLRCNSNRGHVAFCGRLAPVVGRVSMDVTAVDVTEFTDNEVCPGSLAEIVGPTITYRKLAADAGTNEHEALIALGRGCRRVYAEA